MNMRALDVGEAIAHAGRSDVATRFHANNYSRSEVKQAQREKVLDFILRNSAADHSLRMLTMPGADWTFERMAQAERPMSQFIGVERSFTVFARSRIAMPKGLQDKGDPEFAHLQDREISFGRTAVHYSRVAANRPPVAHGNGKRKSRSNRLVLMDVGSFVSMLATDWGATMQERKAFYDKFYRRNSVWLDFTGPLSQQTETAIRHLHFVLSMRAAPVALTLLNGRDRFHSMDERVRRIREIQPGFYPLDAWTYAGAGNSSMLTVCGILT